MEEETTPSAEQRVQELEERLDALFEMYDEGLGSICAMFDEQQLATLQTGIASIESGYAPPGQGIPEGRVQEILDRILEIAELATEGPD